MRALRASLDLTPMKPIPLAYYEGDISGGESVLASQAWISDLRSGKPEGRAISASVSGVTLHLPLSDELVDVDKLLASLEREEKKLSDESAKLEQRLGNAQFVERAKPEIVERERQQLVDLKQKLAAIHDRRKLFGG